MTDYTATIKSKGLDSTGVTEEVARKLYSKLGGHMMFIVEGTVDSCTENIDGSKRVHLSLTQVEPAIDDALAEHLRELTRTLYQNRAVADGQAALDDTLIPDIKDAVAEGARHKPHPFLPTDAADDLGSCEVCGLSESAAPHRAFVMNQQADPFAAPQDGEADKQAHDVEEPLPVP